MEYIRTKGKYPLCRRQDLHGADTELTEKEGAVLSLMQEDSSISGVKIASITGIPKSTVERIIKKLKAQNRILREGTNRGGMEINRLSALRTRAYENMLAVATCNYPDGQPDCNGHSTVFDSVAWLRDEPGARDMCILEAPGEEGIYIADIDLDLLREYRANEVMGNRYRHPETYKRLVSEQN